MKFKFWLASGFLLALLSVHAAPGDADPTFNVGADSTVWCMAVQSDGKSWLVAVLPTWEARPTQGSGA